MQFFQCGGDDCPKGGKHEWDGPEKTWTDPCAHCDGAGCEHCDDTGEGCSGGSATCSKCGLDAMSHTLMNAPDPEWPPTRFDRIQAPSVHLLKEDGTSWCSMTKHHGPVSTWPETDIGSKNPEEATCKACLGRHHRATG